MNTSEHIVCVNNLVVEMGGRTLLRGINLQLKPGELVSVLGANGAGKSTLLKSLTGMVFPKSGTIEILGRTVEARLHHWELRKLRAEVGQVFQGLHLVSRLTAMENVLIGRLAKNSSVLTWLRIYSREDKDKAMQALERVGMADRAHERIDLLSGGERQKIALARVLAQEAKLVLADEPTANLDPQAACEIARLLQELASHLGIGVLTVVHNFTVLPLLGGRVLGLKQGEVQFDCLQNALPENRLMALYASSKNENSHLEEKRLIWHQL
jgi:phosphonate transport system ATP-binding protein